MNKLLITLTLPCLLSMACQSRIRVANSLEQAQALMEQRPDSALALLETLPAESLPGRMLKARHALLLSQALDKNFIDLVNDSVISPAVSFYARHGSARERAYTYYYLGCIRYNDRQLDEAVKAMVRAERHALETGDEYLLARIYSCLGRMHQDQYSFEEAMTMFDNAERCFRDGGDLFNTGKVAMNRAMVLSLMELSEEAIDEYHRAQTLFEEAGDSSMRVAITRSVVNELEKDERVPADSLKRLLRSAYAATTAGIVPEADYPMWVALYSRENNLDSARYYAERALVRQEVTPNEKCGMLTQLFRLEEKTGDYRNAVKHRTEYMSLYDSIVRLWKMELVQEAEKRYRNQELRYTNKLLRIRNTYINIGWGVAILLLLALSGVLWLRTVRRYKQFIDTLNENYDTFRERYLQLAKEMENGSDEESALLDALETKLKGFQELLDLAYNPRKPHHFIDDFKDYVKTISKDETAFADLQYVVNKRCYGLVDHLKKDHPELTDYELDMLCMLQFGFSFNCIRLLHHHNNIYSLYSRRTKIHRKLGLPAHYRLEDYLRETTERLKTEKPSGQSPSSNQATEN